MSRTEPVAQDFRKLNELHLPHFQAAVKKLDEARANAETAKADHPDDDRAQQLAREAAAEEEAAKSTALQADAAAKPVKRFLDAGWFAVAGFALLALMLGTAAFVRSTGRLPLGIGTVGSLGLVAFLVFALGVADRTQASTGSADGDVAHGSLSKKAAPATGMGLALAQGADIAPAPHAPPKSDRTGNGFTASGLPPVPGSVQMAKGTASGKDGFGMPGGGFQGAFGGPGALPGIGGGIGGGMGGAPAGDVIYPHVPVIGAKLGDKSDKFPLPLGPLGGGKHGGPGRMGGIEQAFPIWPFTPFPTAGLAPALTKPNNTAPSTPSVPGMAPGGGAGPGGNATRGSGDGWQPNGDGKHVTDDEIQAKRHKAADLASLRPPAPAFGQPTAMSGASIASAESGPKHPAFSKLPAIPMLPGATAKDEADRAINDADQMVKQVAESWSNTLRQEIDLGLKKLQDLQKKEPQGGPVKVPTQSERDGYYRTFNNIQAAVPNATPLVAREYAPPRPGSTPSDTGLTLFESDTIYWQPVIVMPADGKTTLNFNLGSAEGGYQVLLAGHTLEGKNSQEGRIGAIRRIIPVTPPTQTVLPTANPPFAPAAPVESKAP
jgi:hypothetical protein